MKSLPGVLLLATFTLAPFSVPTGAVQTAPAQATEEQKQQLVQLNQEVATLANGGNYKDALEKAKKAESLAEKAFGKQSAEHAVTLQNLGNIYIGQGKSLDAIDYFKRANAVYEGVPRAEGRRIRLYKEIAAAYRLRNDLLACRDNLQKAITLSEGLTKLLNADGVELLFDYAAILELLKKPKDAEPVWARGLDILNNINGGRIDVVQLPVNALNGRRKKEGYVKQEQTSRGVVAVNVIVDETGKVAETSLITGRDEITPIAMQIAKETIYNPLIFNGKPLKMTGVIVYRFPLERAGQQQIEKPLSQKPGDN